MKKDLRVIKTKALLQEALVTLLQQKSLEHIKIAELCKVANVSRGTFYLHYEDVAQLFGEYFEALTQDLRQAYYEPYVRTQYKIENIDSNMIRIFHHVEKHKAFYTIVFNESTPLAHYYQFHALICELLKESVEPLQHDHLAFVLSSRANMIIGFIMQWVQQGFQQTPEEMNEMLLRTNQIGKEHAPF